MNQSQFWEDLELPVVPYVSFAKIFDQWEAWATDNDHPRQIEAQNVLKQVGDIDELRTPFRDLKLLDEFADEIALILSDLFPESLQENEIKTASLPFQPFFFNATSRFLKILENADEDFKLQMRDGDQDYFYIVSASFYLKMKYGAPIDLSRPQLFDIPDKVSGLIRTYRAFFNADFATIVPKEGTTELTHAQVDDLLGNSEDIDLWKKLIPPNSYEFYALG